MSWDKFRFKLGMYMIPWRHRKNIQKAMMNHLVVLTLRHYVAATEAGDVAAADQAHRQLEDFGISIRGN